MIFLVCQREPLKYSEDYCDSLIEECGFQYILYEKSPNEVKIDPQHVYIFRLIAPDNIECPKNIFVMNTEQLSREKWINIMNSYAQRKIKIVTYDLYQSESLSYHPLYLPYPIVSSENNALKKLLQCEKIYDVAFCSVNSPKRENIFNILKNQGVKVVNVTGWKHNRDKVIAKSKILINIHYDDTYNIFEHIRCDRWIFAGLMVVSETSSSDSHLDHKDLLTITSYQSLVPTILNILENYDSNYSVFMKKLETLGPKIIEQRSQQCRKVIEAITT